MKLNEIKFLSEAKNVHMTHVEDSILDQGIDGAHKSIDYLNHVTHILKGNTNKHVKVTTKYDGSPAIFAGKHPENGKFFVGTKGVFSKAEPKIIYSSEDADKFYGDKPDLANILKLAIKYLPSLGIKGIVQGDIMFTHDMLKKHKYDGDNYVTFTPNTITYAVPSGSHAEQLISKAKLGVIFHTKYTGNSMDSLSSSFDVDVNQFKPSANVWVDDASYKDLSGTATLTNKELKDIEKHIQAAEKTLKTIDSSKLDELPKTIKGLLHQHLNQMIRKGKHISNPGKHADELVNFFHDRAAKHAGTDKSESEERARDRRIQFVDQSKPLLKKIFKFQSHLNDAKIAIIDKLEDAASMGTFEIKDGALVPTKQEGFVAVEHLTNNAIKLVDRLDFSQKNFQRSGS